MARQTRRIAPLLVAAALAAIPATAGEIEQGQMIVDGSGGATLLAGATGVAPSPDGRHVYVTGVVDDGVTAFERDRITGRLGFVAQYQDGIGGVQGIQAPRGLAVSPDGRHVYVAASAGGGSLAVFARNASTGQLTFVEFQQNGVLGVQGLTGAGHVAVSPDGRHVYVGSELDDAVAIFSRDATSGALDYLGLVQDGAIDGLAGVQDVVLSPDGAFLYAAGKLDDAVAVFGRNAGTGLLSFVERVRNGLGPVTGLSLPEELAVAPDGRHLYAAAEGGVVVFERNLATGTLAFVQALTPNLTFSKGVQVGPDGRLVFVTSSGNRLSVFSRDPATGQLTIVDFRQQGVDGVSGLSSPGSLAQSPDGAHLYVPSYNAAAVSLFSTRRVAFREVEKNGLTGVTGLQVPIGVAWSPDGRHAYVAAAGSDSVAVFSFDAASESLSFVEADVDGAGGGDALRSPRDVAVSPDGKHVYVVAAIDDSISTFSRDAATGALTFVGSLRDGVGGVEYMNQPLGVTMSADGARVLVASQEGLARFGRNPATGVLTYLSNAVADSLPNAVAVSPDGKHVYLSAPGADAITILSYNVGTGFLDYVDSVYDGMDGVSGLADASDLVVSPDGAHVYVAAMAAVPIFERDPGSGLLTFVGAVQNGVDGVRGLEHPAGIGISPDGHFVLVTSFDSDSVVVFARDGTSGGLTFAQVEFDGVAGVDGLDGPAGVAVAPNGRHTLSVGRGTDNSLVLFAPEPGVAEGAVGALAALLCLSRRRG